MVKLEADPFCSVNNCPSIFLVSNSSNAYGTVHGDSDISRTNLETKRLLDDSHEQRQKTMPALGGVVVVPLLVLIRSSLVSRRQKAETTKPNL